MPAQRKVFRIEESAQRTCGGAMPLSPADDEGALRHHEFMTEIRRCARCSIRAAQVEIATAMPSGSARRRSPRRRAYKHELDLIHAAIQRTKQDIGGLEVGAFIGPQMARVGRELDAIVAGTEQATQKILQSRRGHRSDRQHTVGAAQGRVRARARPGIQDRVVQIFEACNFQDLTGQRVAKVVRR